MLRCPGSDLDSPTTWHFTDTPDTVAGRVACGTYQQKAGVTWTRNAELLLGDSISEDLTALHRWWLKYA
jgi:serine/threonine-protein kinase